MRRGIFWLLIGVVILVVICGAAGLLIYRSSVLVSTTPIVSGTQGTSTYGGPTAGTNGGAGGIGINMGKPQLVARTFKGCPPSGDGGDPQLNTLKDRIDEGQWQPTTIADVLALTWPQAIEYKSRYMWSAGDAAQIAQHEGSPLQMEGYLVSVKQQSPESCNCHAVDYVDFHMWLVDDPNKDRTQSVVVELSPRVRDVHPAWTLNRMEQIVSNREKVRISGWLMMDPEHPDQIGKTRGTIWEIHPVMQIEVQSGGGWAPLDNGTTGVSSAPASQETIPLITPQITATMPPAGDTSVQTNNVVQITDLHYDGATSSESDEYVEITNTSAQPVDITDWVLQKEGGDELYKWESYTMRPGQKIRVYTNEVHNSTGGFSLGSGRAVWNNKGAVALLLDSDKQLVSRYAYGDQK